MGNCVAKKQSNLNLIQSHTIKSAVYHEENFVFFDKSGKIENPECFDELEFQITEYIPADLRRLHDE